MLLDFNEWNYARCKGRITAYVSRGKEKPERIIKSIRTTMAKGNLGSEALERILQEVERESVQPFLGEPWNQPKRLERFRLIKEQLEYKRDPVFG